MASASGGDKLKAKLDQMANRLGSAKSVRVGFLENTRYPDGTLVAMVAAINEYGRPTVGQPPRPFFRDMIREKSPEWPDAIASLLKTNDYDAARTLDTTGGAIKGQLQTAITQYEGPPLKPATVAAKGFDKALVDTGFMLKSVDYEVVKD